MPARDDTELHVGIVHLANQQLGGRFPHALRTREIIVPRLANALLLPVEHRLEEARQGRSQPHVDHVHGHRKGRRFYSG